MSLTETLIPVALMFLVLQSPLVICAGWFAPIIGAKRWLWVGLTAIPWLGLLFGYVLIFRGFGSLLDALERRNQLQSKHHLENRLNSYPDTGLPLEPIVIPPRSVSVARRPTG